jgi:hypothetical protein
MPGNGERDMRTPFYFNSRVYKDKIGGEMISSEGLISFRHQVARVGGSQRLNILAHFMTRYKNPWGKIKEDRGNLYPLFLANLLATGHCLLLTALVAA